LESNQASAPPKFLLRNCHCLIGEKIARGSHKKRPLENFEIPRRNIFSLTYGGKIESFETDPIVASITVLIIKGDYFFILSEAY